MFGKGILEIPNTGMPSAVGRCTDVRDAGCDHFRNSPFAQKRLLHIGLVRQNWAASEQPFGCASQ